MPKILDAAVKRLKAKGFSTSSAYAIGTSTLQKAKELKQGHNTPTKLGTKRGAMSRAERHKHPLVLAILGFLLLAFAAPRAEAQSACHTYGTCTPLPPGQYNIGIATATALTVPVGTIYAVVQAVGQSLNYTTDGQTTPTATLGINLPAGASVALGGGAAISRFRAITTTAGGLMSVEYFK